MSSRLDDVLTALVTTFTTALPAALVFDGPPVSDAPAGDMVFVDHDETPDSAVESTFEQEWANLACSSRYERGEVVCCVVSQTGDTDMKARRDQAFVLLAACEAALLADPSLGGVVMEAQLARAGARQVQNSKGSAVVVPFTVTYFAQV